VARRHIKAEDFTLGGGDDPILIQQKIHKIAARQFGVPEFPARRTVESDGLAMNPHKDWRHAFTSTPAHSSTVLTIVVKSASHPGATR